MNYRDVIGLVLKRDQCASWPCKRAFKFNFQKNIQDTLRYSNLCFSNLSLILSRLARNYFQKVNYAYLLKLRNDI